MRQKPTQIIAEIRRVRERCPIFNPLICTAATARIERGMERRRVHRADVEGLADLRFALG
jgi:hypothetical protein